MSFVRILTNEQETFDWIYTDSRYGQEVPRHEVQAPHAAAQRDSPAAARPYDLPTPEGRKAARKSLTIAVTWMTPSTCASSAGEGVQGAERDKDGNFVDTVLPCERKYKLMLPEPLKIEIGRVCFNRDADALFDDADDDDTDPQKPGKSSR